MLAIFQKRINSILGEHLDEFIMAYLDNIIIYSNSKEEHFKYIKWVLQKLVDKKMLVAIKKYKFHITKTEFYKFIIKLRKFNIDLKRINSVLGEHLDEFIIAYLNNIIIYFSSEEEHFQYIK